MNSEIEKNLLEIANADSWIIPVSGKPFIIAGPCSAESEFQLVETALALKKTGKVSVLRAGIWKPRTRPNAFEGVGRIGLKWLKTAKKESGLPTTVEVATAKHVEDSLKNEVDMLWIGARTTVNPFSVKEIAEALKGVDIPVFIKNPVNPDLQLWIGALERINRAGIKKIAAIHRGFSFYGKSIYRNEPMWAIPIELKRLFPELPILCDPSHISGARKLIPSLAQEALDLDFQGLMIESHINPDKALTDAKQQFKPEDLALIINNLIVRSVDSADKNFVEKLSKMRALIDKLDDEILQSISSRMSIVEEIADFKKENNVTILQLKRWEEIIEKRTEMASSMNLSQSFTKKLLTLIHEEAIARHSEIMNKQSVDSIK